MKTVDPVALLKRRLGSQSQAEFSRAHGISRGYLNDVLRGRKPPGDMILTLLGVRRVYVLERQP